MSASVFEVFVAMFYALDAAYDMSHEKELGQYLSDANPFLFTDEGSADAAEYEHFKEAYMATFSGNASGSDSLLFVKKYLAMRSALLLEAFDSVVTEESWNKAIE